MRTFAKGMSALAFTLLLGGTAHAANATAGDTIQVQDMTLTVPDGWSLRQDAKDDGTIILGFENGAKYLTLYVKHQTGLDMHQIFVNGSQIVHDVHAVPRNRYTWNVLETSKSLTERTNFIASFLTEVDGYSYYGYTRGTSSVDAMASVTSFLNSLR
jgi:hypothetical protein